MDAVVAIVVSLLCVFVVVIMSVVTLYQTSRIKEQTAKNMQDLVDQVNDSATYAYRFDISQDDNIKTMERNLNMLNDNINNVAKNVKVIQDNINEPAKYSKNIRTGILTLGNQFTLSEVPEDPGWLGLKDKDNAKLYGGLAVSRMYVNDDAYVNSLGVLGSLKVVGGKTSYNPNKLPTILADADGANYIRGDTSVDGLLNVAGNVKFNDKVCIKETCIAEPELKAIIGSIKPSVQFPPKLTGPTTAINGLVYTVSASSRNNANTEPWALFNGGIWQSAGGKYNPMGVALAEAPFPSGFVDNYGGEWISLQLPYDITLTKYSVVGDLLDFRVYGQTNISWKVMDERTLSAPPLHDVHLFTLVPPIHDKVRNLLIKINRTASNSGTCTLVHLAFYGIR